MSFFKIYKLDSHLRWLCRIFFCFFDDFIFNFDLFFSFLLALVGLLTTAFSTFTLFFWCFFFFWCLFSTFFTTTFTFNFFCFLFLSSETMGLCCWSLIPLKDGCYNINKSFSIFKHVWLDHCFKGLNRPVFLELTFCGFK